MTHRSLYGVWQTLYEYAHVAETESDSHQYSEQYFFGEVYVYIYVFFYTKKRNAEH